MSNRTVWLIALLSAAAYGQDAPLLIEAPDAGRYFMSLLGSLGGEAACPKSLAAKDEFETTAAYQTRFRQYAENGERLLRDAVERFNARRASTVSISFSLAQGRYDADGGTYSLIPKDHMEIPRGVSFIMSEPMVNLGVEGDFGTRRFVVRPGWVGLRADSVAARRLRGREQQMRVVVAFRLVARAQKAGAFEYSLALVLSPFKLEVRDPLEAQPIIFTANLTPGRDNDNGLLRWHVAPGERCGVN